VSLFTFIVKIYHIITITTTNHNAYAFSATVSLSEHCRFTGAATWFRAVNVLGLRQTTTMS